VDKPGVVTRVCPDGRPAHVLLGGASVRIVDDAAGAGAHLDTIDAGSALTDIDTLGGLGVVAPLVRPGTTIVAGVN